MKAPVTLGLAAVGAVAFLCLPRPIRARLTAMARQWITGRLEHVMANLPEGSPPKLVMSILPRLREQNDQIIALLQEQNGLLREWQRTAIIPHSSD